MNHNLLSGHEAPSESSEEWRTALRKKVRLSAALVAEQVGTPHPLLRAELLYDMLVHPAEVAELHGIDTDAFDDRKEMLESKLLGEEADEVLPREEFSVFMVDILNGPELHEKSVFPGALEALAELTEKGPVILWTQGDMHGEAMRRDGTKVSGRGEQIRKLVGIGIGPLRRRLAKAAFGDITVPKQREKIDVAIAENKFEPRIFGQVADYVRAADSIIIIEDHRRFIEKLRQGLIERDIDKDKIRAFLVKQGKKETLDGVTQVASMAEVPGIVDSLEGKVGSIVDFDGVLADQAKRAELLSDAVETFLADHHVPLSNVA